MNQILFSDVLDTGKFYSHGVLYMVRTDCRVHRENIMSSSSWEQNVEFVGENTMSSSSWGRDELDIFSGVAEWGVIFFKCAAWLRSESHFGSTILAYWSSRFNQRADRIGNKDGPPSAVLLLRSGRRRPFQKVLAIYWTCYLPFITLKNNTRDWSWLLRPQEDT